MNENRTKRNTNQNGLDMLEWMLAIDFDPVEARCFRNGVFQNYVHVLDKTAFRTRSGD
jgi:hypothetical protein